MSKLINHYDDGLRRDTWRNRYVAFRAEHPKHMYYMVNRKRSEACLDYYDRYVLENLRSGTTMAFDIAGYYLKDAIQDLVIVERMGIATDIDPDCVISQSPAALTEYHGKISNLLVSNTLVLKWKTLAEWTDWWVHNSVVLKPGAHVFCSFRDNRIMRNRLKVKFRDQLNDWFKSMEAHGFYVKDYSYDPCPVGDNVTDYQCAGEIDDTTNGNLKIFWRYEK